MEINKTIPKTEIIKLHGQVKGNFITLHKVVSSPVGGAYVVGDLTIAISQIACMYDTILSLSYYEEIKVTTIVLGNSQYLVYEDREQILDLIEQAQNKRLYCN